MGEPKRIVTKVWIAPGCIVCNACEEECPDVFDVQADSSTIRPAALDADVLRPLTPAIIAAAEGCPVEVIQFETAESDAAEPQPPAEPSGTGE